MRRMLNSLLIAFFCVFTCAAPALSCKASQMTPEEQVQYNGAISRGDTKLAREIREGANRRQTYEYSKLFLDFLPAIPDAVKGGLATVASVVGAGLFFPRSRKHYGSIFSGIARAAVALTPVNGPFSPTQAVREVAGSARSVGASLGYVHTEKPVE